MPTDDKKPKSTGGSSIYKKPVPISTTTTQADNKENQAVIEANSMGMAPDVQLANERVTVAEYGDRMKWKAIDAADPSQVESYSQYGSYKYPTNPEVAANLAQYGDKYAAVALQNYDTSPNRSHSTGILNSTTEINQNINQAPQMGAQHDIKGSAAMPVNRAVATNFVQGEQNKSLYQPPSTGSIVEGGVQREMTPAEIELAKTVNPQNQIAGNVVPKTPEQLGYTQAQWMQLDKTQQANIMGGANIYSPSVEVLSNPNAAETARTKAGQITASEAFNSDADSALVNPIDEAVTAKTKKKTLNSTVTKPKSTIYNKPQKINP